MAGGDLVRRVIDGRFELGGRLGGGGMGLVWRARDLALHRDVALKEVRPPDPALAEYDPEAARTLRARVLREARALARVDHPNVVTVHHIVDADDGSYPWIVMELVQGGSLQDRLEEGPLAPAEAARIGRGVLSALRAAHAVGIHHRDVKPANVLLRPDGRPVLTDFGIAALRESTSLTATGALIGSPDYIAPERIRGTEGDPASDLWSLGMLLYVAVEGRHPLRKATTLATLAAILDEELPPPVRAGALTPVLAAVLTRDIAARPDADALDAMLAEAETVAEAAPEAEAGPGGGAPADPRAGWREPSARPAAPPGMSPSTPPPSTASPTAAPTPAGGTGTPPPTDARPPWPADGVPPQDARPPGPGGPGGYVPTATSGPAGRPAGEAGRGNGARPAVLIASVAGTLAVGLLAWAVLPGLISGTKDDAGRGAGVSPGATHTPGAIGGVGALPDTGGSGDDDAEPAKETNLLTPTGVRSVITALKPVMGGTKVTDFTLYPDHASASALVKGSAVRYDDFSYRDGQAARDRAGGSLTSDEKPVDLNTFDWDKLPALLKEADKLGVTDPTGHYVIVEPAWVFADNQPTLLVYTSGEYGGAYLAANRAGKVLERHPAEK